VDLVRFGVVIRALRRRRGWRQVDLARAAGVSQTLVSLIERGHADRVLLANVIAVCAALEARVSLEVRWRAGELDRLLDQDHAGLVSAISTLLSAWGWEVQLEVTYAIYGATGSIDVLAWHAPTRSLLVIEIKTEVTSAEATIRKLDEKARLAAQVALERFGWRAATVSRLLVIEDTTTARSRVNRARGVFEAAFPLRGLEVRRWLRSPAGPVSALMFLPNSSTSAGMSRRGGRHRVRRAPRAPQALASSVGSRRGAAARRTVGPEDPHAPT
jgi:transcriptional regulator with XRE-family HTH domain